MILGDLFTTLANPTDTSPKYKAEDYLFDKHGNYIKKNRLISAAHDFWMIASGRIICHRLDI